MVPILAGIGRSTRPARKQSEYSEYRRVLTPTLAAPPVGRAKHSAAAPPCGSVACAVHAACNASWIVRCVLHAASYGVRSLALIAWRRLDQIDRDDIIVYGEDDYLCVPSTPRCAAARCCGGCESTCACLPVGRPHSFRSTRPAARARHFLPSTAAVRCRSMHCECRYAAGPRGASLCCSELKRRASVGGRCSFQPTAFKELVFFFLTYRPRLAPPPPPPLSLPPSPASGSGGIRPATPRRNDGGPKFGWVTWKVRAALADDVRGPERLHDVSARTKPHERARTCSHTRNTPRPCT